MADIININFTMQIVFNGIQIKRELIRKISQIYFIYNKMGEILTNLLVLFFRPSKVPWEQIKQFKIL